MADSTQLMEDSVRQLLQVAGGDHDIPTGERLLADDVLMHMDGYNLRGIRRWREFIRYLRHCRSLLGLHLACDKVETEDDRATFFGHWYHPQREMPDAPVVATFRFDGDRIVELWSRRKNYVSLFGTRILTKWGFFTFALRAYLWCKVSRVEKLRWTRKAGPVEQG